MSTFIKKERCPNCGPNFLFSKEWTLDEETGEWAWAWECTNCLHRIPFRERGHRVERMTPTQERLVEEIQKAALEDHCADNPALDHLKVSLLETGSVQISFRVHNGLPGTLGYVFPDSYSIIIGRRGKLTSYAMDERGKDGKRTGKLITVTSPRIWRHRRSI
jgi:hypothetical protein